MEELYWNILSKLRREYFFGTTDSDVWNLIHQVELNMYICFGIITLLLIALIVIVLIKKK